jgi:hypothetical protein
MEIIGIASNFGSWIFTKYKKLVELTGGESPFLVSQQIDVLCGSTYTIDVY